MTECMHKRTTQSALRRNGTAGELSVCAECGAEVDFRLFRAEDMPGKIAEIVEEKAGDVIATSLKTASGRVKIEAPAPRAEAEEKPVKRVNPLEKVREARRALESARLELELAVRDLPAGSMVKVDGLLALYRAIVEAKKRLKEAESY